MTNLIPTTPGTTPSYARFHGPDGALRRARQILPFSDVLRTYDVSNPLSVATTVDRVAQILTDARVVP